ncbi:MAG: hypothetical protein AAF727_05955 [Pseudomonadota bacterium]
MEWHSEFVGRADDLHVLQSAWDEVRGGQTRVLAIVAESGFGKTRLAQEFYNWLSTAHDGVGDAGYWPDRLLRDEDNLRVNPDTSEANDPATSMPFLWWGLRLADPGVRNAITISAFAGGLQQLNPHLAVMQRDIERAAIKRRQRIGGGKTASELALTVGETAIDVVSSVGTFGLLGLAKTLGEAAWDQRAAARELKELDTLDVRPAAAEARARDRLAEIAIEDLSRLCHQPPKGVDPVPLVILIDDIQWLQSDAGTESFLTLLLDRARTEGWPLLVVLTCWRREWRSSQSEGRAPGTLVRAEAGDIVHDLGPLDGLETIVEQVFPGLTADQVIALCDKAEGTPRLMDEMLMYLRRRRKAFVDRDTGAALTDAGLEDVLSRDFAEFIADRLQQAPDHVRRALAIASMQGVSFSPRIVHRLAEGLAIVDAETGLLEGDDPHSFVSGASTRGGAEFRLRAYRAAAREDLGNLLDEVDVEDSLRDALLEIANDPSAASDQELTLILNAPGIFEESVDAWRSQIIAAGTALIERANRDFDTRKAGTLAEDMLALFEGPMVGENAGALVKVVDAAFEWRGPHRALVAPLLNLAEHLAQRVNAQPETLDTVRFQALGRVYGRIAEIVGIMDGPRAAQVYDEEGLAIKRHLAEHRPGPAQQHDLAVALINNSRMYSELSQLDEARALAEESIGIFRDLCADQDTEELWLVLAKSLGYLSDYIAAADGPEAAVALRTESYDILRGLSAKDATPDVQSTLALALDRMADTALALDDTASALSFRKEEEQILRGLVEVAPALRTRRDLSLTLSSFGHLVETLQGPAAAQPYWEEAASILRALFEESALPSLQGDLALDLTSLGGVAEALDGPAAARPFYEEAVDLHFAWAKESPTAKTRLNLARALGHLINVVLPLDGAAAVQVIRENQVQLLRDYVEEVSTPDARLELSIAIAYLGNLEETLDSAQAAHALREEEVALTRRAFEDAPAPNTRQGLCNALYRLGGSVETLEGPAAARPIREEQLELSRVIANEQMTPEKNLELSLAITNLANVIDGLDGPAATLSLWQEAVTIERSVADAQWSEYNAVELARSLHSYAAALHHTHAPDAAHARWHEALDVLHRAVQEDPNPNLTHWILNVRQHALRAKVMGAMPWDGPFAVEVLPRVSPDDISACKDLCEAYRGWATLDGVEQSAVWVATADVDLARYMFANGQLPEADALLASLRDIVRSEYDADLDFAGNLMHAHTLMCGIVALAADRPQDALDHFDRIDGINAVQTAGDYTVHRRVAAVEWFRTKAFEALDLPDRAAASLAAGTAAARTFAAFGVMDGQPILNAFLAKASGSEPV